MAQTAIIFTTNRVVRRITVDPSPPIASDETAIIPAALVDFSAFNGGRVKLDVSNNPVQATAAEWRAAGLDDAFNNATRQALVASLKSDITAARNAIQTMNADATVPASVKTAMLALAQVIKDQLDLMNAL